jgi:hypothetical protein
MLLYWCGDYPGQGEASGFSHAPGGKKACHWCEILGKKSMTIKRQKYDHFFRYIRLTERFCVRQFIRLSYIYLQILPNICRIFFR